MNDTRNWQVSINDPLEVVDGVNDIAQCIYTVLNTVPGSDPLRSDFGSNVYRYVDQPIVKVQPQMIYDVITAIGRWEKRIEVTKCTVEAVGVDGRILNIEAVVVASAKQITITINI